MATRTLTSPAAESDTALADDPQSEEGEPLGRLSRNELRRRLWHMSPGLLPFVLWFIPHRDPISPLFYAIIFLVAGSIGAGIYFGYNRIRREDENNQRLLAIAGYAGTVVGMLVLFPGDAELGLTVLGILAFGDGSATLFGLLLPGRRLPWNPRKTFSGLAAFVLVGGAMAALIYWGETHNPEAANPPVAFSTALVCGLAAALAGAVAESFPSRRNDNLRVGLAAAAALVVAHGFVVGWW